MSSEYDSRYTEYQLKPRSFLRQLVRNIYLRKAVSYVDGKAIDFGCGPGELLARLPAGSVGLEVNPDTVSYCLSKQMNVKLYDPEKDDYRFEFAAPGDYSTIIISHVLEHIPDAQVALKKMISSAKRLRIGKVVVIVPCRKGFSFDKTHKVLVDREYLEAGGFMQDTGFRIKTLSYFPLNMRSAGDMLTYQEMHVVFVSHQ